MTIDKERLRVLASDFRSHPLSQHIAEVEEAGEGLYALLAENAALAAEVERTSNNRDMWKAQCAAQAKELERLRKDERGACAKVCDEQAESHELFSNTQATKGCDDCAAAIRARSTE